MLAGQSGGPDPRSPSVGPAIVSSIAQNGVGAGRSIKALVSCLSNPVSPGLDAPSGSHTGNPLPGPQCLPCAFPAWTVVPGWAVLKDIRKFQRGGIRKNSSHKILDITKRAAAWPALRFGAIETSISLVYWTEHRFLTILFLPQKERDRRGFLATTSISRRKYVISAL